MFSKSNILYPTILTPKELYLELVENYRFLPESKQLPVPLILDNMHTILNISEISSYFNKEKVVFAVKIPIINPIHLNIYHNLPSLVAHDKNNPESYSTIIPSSKDIGISKDRSMYSFNNIVSKLPVVNLKNVNLDSLAYDDPEILKSLNSIIEKPHIVLYQKYYSGITIVIIVFIMCFIIYKMYKTCIHKKIMKSKENKTPEFKDIELDDSNPSNINTGPSLRIG
ncbi:unnamed protein product [Parnassius mnemosyne]|uniref:Uncharacterized protein n=1 Tax=Parnassius mnemosyne TaxID=213953 RepID=A0AAV1LQN8_9NEOP